MKRIISFALAIVAFVCAAWSQSSDGLDQDAIAGPWHGEIAVGSQHLPIVFNIALSANGYSATMDSPAQGAKGIVSEITVEGNAIDIAIPSIGAKYTGEIAAKEIQGKFSQNGMSFPLNLQAGEYIPPRPQTPHPPYIYETREVSIVNPVDSATLSGTLTLPVQYNMPLYGTKKFPLVVMVTGSGQQNRDEEIFGHRPFAVIAHQLALSGIMSLRYDDRGFGQSTGDLTHATTATFASDAKAAIDWVRENVERADEIGVLGHSEGGSIAFMLAADDAADFIITLGAPAVSGKELLLLQNQALLGKSAATDEYVTALGRVLDYMCENPGATQWPGLEQAISDLPLIPQPLIDNLHQVIATRNPWLDFFIAYDPSEDIRNTKVPALVLYGSLDTQVPADVNLGTIRHILPENPYSVLKEYPGLNHLMQHASSGLPAEYPMIEETISPQVLSDISQWLNTLP